MKTTWKLLALLISGCAFVQKPVDVSDSSLASQAPVVNATAKPVRIAEPVVQEPKASAGRTVEGLGLDSLATLARTRQKNPAALKPYVGQRLTGQAKFVKTAKGNPNAVVADVRVNGVGEVSLWCRSVLGVVPPGRMSTFEGTLTGEVYTSEDFSNDLYLKDCRFRD